MENLPLASYGRLTEDLKHICSEKQIEAIK